MILLFSAIRWRLRDMPLERDEGEYGYAGQLILQGIPPYQIAYNMKLPGTYAAYAVIMAVFGQTAAGIRIGLLLVNALTIFLMYALGKRLLGARAGVVASATYGLLSVGPWVNGFAGHATHFVVLAAIAGLLLLLQAVDEPLGWKFFLAGFLLGLAFLMKQPGLAFTVFGACTYCGPEFAADKSCVIRFATCSGTAQAPFCPSPSPACCCGALESLPNSGSGLFPMPTSTPPISASCSAACTSSRIFRESFSHRLHCGSWLR